MLRLSLLDVGLWLLVTILLAVGLYLEWGLGVQPCLLCLLQRVSWLSLWLCFLLLAIVNWPRWFRHTIEGFGLVWTILGMLWAIRQVWLQLAAASSGHQHLACLPSAYFLIQHTPLSQIMRMALAGTDDCALVHWTVGGISLAWWSLLAFSLVALILLGRWLRRYFV